MTAAATEAVALLEDLIRVPRLSKEEHASADVLSAWLSAQGVTTQRVGNNLFAARQVSAQVPTLWLCSHHDTVPAGASWTRDPHQPEVADGRLYGLGSTDAGGALVSMMSAFVSAPAFIKFNLGLAVVAEEEISGAGGLSLLLQHVPAPNMAIVGEPTSLQVAVAEKGLLVVDAVCHGQTGHAAREEGDNALYKAVSDIAWIRAFQDPEPSPWLGPLKMTVTQLTAGEKHNVVPDRAQYVIDIRLTERWPHARVLDLLRQHLQAELTPRSTRLNPSGIAQDHPLAQAAIAAGCQPYGSPTLSDMALMPCPSIKLGPGDSARSHTPDEWIAIADIEAGIKRYLDVLHQLDQRL